MKLLTYIIIYTLSVSQEKEQAVSDGWKKKRNKQPAETTTRNTSHPSSTCNNDAQTRGGGREGGIEQNSGEQRGNRETTQKKPDTLEALITTIITEIQTTMKRSEETIRGGKRLIEIETSTLTRWQEKLDAARNASKRDVNNEIITKILTNTKDIKR